MDKSEESVAAGMVGLLYLAREAVEEKRHKQCLEATKAILKIDPEHKEARKIQSAVRTELDQQFIDAQTLARDAQQNDDRILYERAAAALRRIIDVDPDNLEARTLLHDTVAASYFRPGLTTTRTRWKIPGRSILVGSVATVVLVAAIVLVRQTGLQFSDLIPARLESSRVKLRAVQRR
jgi:tetratricopeptide (TPR) repeat protein